MLKITNFLAIICSFFILSSFPQVQAAEESAEGSVDALRVVSVEATDNKTLNVTFNKEVVLPESLYDSFSIQDSEGKILPFSYVSILEDGFSVVIVTELQVVSEEYTLTALSAITGTDGGPMLSGVSDGGVFIGSDVDFSQVVQEEKEEVHSAAPEVEDITPPEDVTNLRTSYEIHPSKSNAYNVGLNWDSSLNSEEDLDFQNYQYKKSETDYSKSIRMDKDKTSYQNILEGGERYTFKISTVDISGNESAGSITSIVLPATGPGLLLGLIGMGSLLSSVAIRRKK
ncbi:hypothetical protein HON22_05015 [Candidatus Peregrinibacteria bacterium]|jgi:hypothetical protein|nr:hypothetical protein [Candidatus Peregrinibacteria bacterium]